MKIVLTGASGFVGSHLLKALTKRGHEIVAIGYHHQAAEQEKNAVRYILNLLDAEGIHTCLAKEKPDGIIHLAAQSNVSLSWKQINYTNELNINGTVNLLEAVAKICPRVKILNIGSSEEYGLTAKTERVLKETMPCAPQNPYAISKYCAGQLALQLGKKYGINLVHVRPFNHFGPGQKKGFVVSDFASQIAEIEAKKKEPIVKVGNLAAYRDFCFIEDIVEAYIRIMEERTENGIYNIASNRARKVEDILRELMKNSKEKIQIMQDTNKIRPLEIPYYIGSSEKLKEKTGWEVQSEFQEGLIKTLEWWRKKTG